MSFRVSVTIFHNSVYAYLFIWIAIIAKDTRINLRFLLLEDIMVSRDSCDSPVLWEIAATELSSAAAASPTDSLFLRETTITKSSKSLIGTSPTLELVFGTRDAHDRAISLELCYARVDAVTRLDTARSQSDDESRIFRCRANVDGWRFRFSTPVPQLRLPDVANRDFVEADSCDAGRRNAAASRRPGIIQL